MHVVPQDFEIERQLEFVEATIARLEAQRDELFQRQKTLSHVSWRRRLSDKYLAWAERVRAPRERFELWYWGLMLVAPATLAAPVFIVAHLISGSLAVSVLSFAVAAALGAMVCGALLFVPSQTRLAGILRDRAADQETITAADRALHVTTENLRRYILERDALKATANCRRTQLLRRDWRALRGSDWIDYLAEMLLALGAVVQLTKKSGEPGVDIIAEFGPRRVAIQANTTDRTIDAAPVRAVASARDAQQCVACAIIGNGRFNPASIRLAAEQHCLLIGVDNFEKFALGEIRL